MGGSQCPERPRSSSTFASLHDGGGTTREYEHASRHNLKRKVIGTNESSGCVDPKRGQDDIRTSVPVKGKHGCPRMLDELIRTHPRASNKPQKGRSSSEARVFAPFTRLIVLTRSIFFFFLSWLGFFFRAVLFRPARCKSCSSESRWGSWSLHAE